MEQAANYGGYQAWVKVKGIPEPRVYEVPSGTALESVFSTVSETLQEVGEQAERVMVRVQ